MVPDARFHGNWVVSLTRVRLFPCQAIRYGDFHHPPRVPSLAFSCICKNSVYFSRNEDWFARACEQTCAIAAFAAHIHSMLVYCEAKTSRCRPIIATSKQFGNLQSPTYHTAGCDQIPHPPLVPWFTFMWPKRSVGFRLRSPLQHVGQDLRTKTNQAYHAVAWFLVIAAKLARNSRAYN